MIVLVVRLFVVLVVEVAVVGVVVVAATVNVASRSVTIWREVGKCIFGGEKGSKS